MKICDLNEEIKNNLNELAVAADETVKLYRAYERCCCDKSCDIDERNWQQARYLSAANRMCELCETMSKECSGRWASDIREAKRAADIFHGAAEADEIERAGKILHQKMTNLGMDNAIVFDRLGIRLASSQEGKEKAKMEKTLGSARGQSGAEESE